MTILAKLKRNKSLAALVIVTVVAFIAAVAIPIRKNPGSLDLGINIKTVNKASPGTIIIIVVVVAHRGLGYLGAAGQ